METYKRKSAFTELEDFCYLSNEHDYMEVTEWRNMEGFDVEVFSKIREKFSMTWGQFKALKKLIKKLEE